MRRTDQYGKVLVRWRRLLSGGQGWGLLQGLHLQAKRGQCQNERSISTPERYGHLEHWRLEATGFFALSESDWCWVWRGLLGSVLRTRDWRQGQRVAVSGCKEDLQLPLDTCLPVLQSRHCHWHADCGRILQWWVCRVWCILPNGEIIGLRYIYFCIFDSQESTRKYTLL